MIIYVITLSISFCKNNDDWLRKADLWKTHIIKWCTLSILSTWLRLKFAWELHVAENVWKIIYFAILMQAYGIQSCRYKIKENAVISVCYKISYELNDSAMDFIDL